LIQNRFFHSSIQEIELHVSEIHSLQDELREKILTSLNKSAAKIKNHEKNIQELDNTSSIVILSEHSPTKLISSHTKNILETSVSENLTPNDELSKFEAIRNQAEPLQSNIDARISDYGINSNLINHKKTVFNSLKEFLKYPDKNVDILIFILSFFIGGINFIFFLFLYWS